MRELNSTPEPYKPPDVYIGELAWFSILYGAMFGTLFGMGALNRMPTMFESFSEAITTSLIAAAAILNASQLPIGVYVLQKQRWAAFASYRTTMALVVLGLISLPLCFLTDLRFLVVAAFPLGFGLSAQNLIKSSEEIQTFLE